MAACTHAGSLRRLLASWPRQVLEGGAAGWAGEGRRDHAAWHCGAGTKDALRCFERQTGALCAAAAGKAGETTGSASLLVLLRRWLDRPGQQSEACCPAHRNLSLCGSPACSSAAPGCAPRTMQM